MVYTLAVYQCIVGIQFACYAVVYYEYSILHTLCVHIILPIHHYRVSSYQPVTNTKLFYEGTLSMDIGDNYNISHYYKYGASLPTMVVQFTEGSRRTNMRMEDLCGIDQYHKCHYYYCTTSMYNGVKIFKTWLNNR